MAESQNQKLDELFLKLRSLGDRAKSARAQLGEPILDRFVNRVSKTLTRFGNNGNGVQQPQPQEAKAPLKVCPQCGRPFVEDVSFCNCGFSFRAREIEEAKKREKEAELERFSKMGVIP